MSESQQALVKNASDENQVKRADLKQRLRTTNEHEDMRAVLATPQGRRMLWRLLEHCKVFESIWHPSALIHHNSGRQDVGHYIMAKIAEADEARLFQMMQEAKSAERMERQANEALNEKGREK